jgi:hypothetical protein
MHIAHGDVLPEAGEQGPGIGRHDVVRLHPALLAIHHYHAPTEPKPPVTFFESGAFCFPQQRDFEGFVTEARIRFVAAQHPAGLSPVPVRWNDGVGVPKLLPGSRRVTRASFGLIDRSCWERRVQEGRMVMGGLAGLVRGIAIGSVPLVIASCAVVFGAGPVPPVRPSAGAGASVSSLMHGTEIPLRGMDPVRWPTRIRGGILLTNRGIAGLLGVLFAF